MSYGLTHGAGRIRDIRSGRPLVLRYQSIFDICNAKCVTYIDVVEFYKAATTRWQSTRAEISVVAQMCWSRGRRGEEEPLELRLACVARSIEVLISGEEEEVDSVKRELGSGEIIVVVRTAAGSRVYYALSNPFHFTR
jgi:hypothetical protein